LSTAINFFDSYALNMEKKYIEDPDFRERFRIWTHLIDKYAIGSVSAIDIGCGAGVFSLYMAKKGINTIGIDGAESMIRTCNYNKEKLCLEKVQFVQAEIPFLPGLEINAADMIICSSVLEYITPFRETISLFARLLKKNGILILSLPNGDSYYRKYEKLKFKFTGKPHYYKHVKNLLLITQLTKTMDEFGFIPLEVHYYANNNRLSKILSKLHFSQIRYNNLFVVVLQKRT